jgi:hypothetical protein
VQHRELERVALAVEQLRPVPALRRPQRRVEPGVGEHGSGPGEQQVRRSMPASASASASMPNPRAAAATSRGAFVRIFRREASSASLASCSNSISAPLITAPSRSGTTRVAIRSHRRSPSEPRFSETRTGSPPRTRSRSCMDWPGTSPLTS